MIKFCLKRLSSTKGFIFLLITGILMSIFELIGIFSLGPFITMVITPENIETNQLFSSIKLYLGIINDRDFITFFGVFTLISIIFGNLINLFHQYLVHKVSYFFGRDLSFEYTKSFLNANSMNEENFQNEDVVKNATVETVRAVEWVIQPIIGAVFRALSLLLIFLALLIYSWKASLSIGLAVFILYLLIFQTLRGWLSSIGDELSLSLANKQLAVGEIIQGKDVIRTDNKDSFFLNRFYDSSTAESRLKALSSLAAFSPKAIMEGIAFGSITGIMLYINIFASDSVGPSFLTSMGIFTVAAYKILPSAQNVYYGISRAVFNKNSLRALVESYKVLIENKNESKLYREGTEDNTEFPFVAIKNISYSSNGKEKKQILDEIDIDNFDSSFIGLVGPSGGGKTSLLKIIAGLEQPYSGTMLLSNSINKISYVSQDLVTFRASLLENITMFDEQPDLKFLEEIWDICQLTFCDIDDAVKLIISDKAGNISGGQSQRINLARALYSKPDLLLLDEFTSALDNEIENKVLVKLKNFSKKNKVKIFMSAHRDSAKEFCDIFYYIKDGKCLGSSDAFTFERL
jgi:ATP-binding cassette, subfamily B, bacterial PglK